LIQPHTAAVKGAKRWATWSVLGVGVALVAAAGVVWVLSAARTPASTTLAVAPGATGGVF
jgi:hypothetical protein